MNMIHISLIEGNNQFVIYSCQFLVDEDTNRLLIPIKWDHSIVPQIDTPIPSDYHEHLRRTLGGISGLWNVWPVLDYVHLRLVYGLDMDLKWTTMFDGHSAIGIEWSGSHKKIGRERIFRRHSVESQILPRISGICPYAVLLYDRPDWLPSGSSLVK